MQSALDRAEVEKLAVRHRADLVRYFARRTRRMEIAEDFAQETFVRLAGLRRQGVIDNLVSYMFRVAASVLMDHARRRRSRGETLQVVVDHEAIASDEPGPERVAEARDRLAALRAVLDEMPPRTREIFLANRLDGASYAELARRHGVSASAIEKHMMKAIAHLQRRREG